MEMALQHFKKIIYKINIAAIKVFNKILLNKDIFKLRLYLYFRSSNLLQDSYKNILIICGHGAGDYLLASSAIMALNNKFRDSSVTVIFTRKEALELAKVNDLHKRHNLIFSRDINLITEKQDIAIILSGSSPEVINILSFLQPKAMIGFIFSFKIFSSIKNISDTKDYLFENHIQRNDQIIHLLGGSPTGNIEFANSSLQSNKKNIIGNFLPITKPLKALNTEQIFEVVDRQIKSGQYLYVYHLVFKDEYLTNKDFYEQLKNQIADDSFKIKVFSNWIELIDLMVSCKKIYCIDSVAYHIANGLNIDSLCIFGPTNAKNYIPNNSVGHTINLNESEIHCYYGTGHKKCICTKNNFKTDDLQCGYMLKLNIEDHYS